MQVINILFEFRNSTHIANVYITSSSHFYTIYFTDVELILDFGSKASYSKQQGLQLLKTGKDAEILRDAIIRQLEQLPEAA
jgi:hypothetical protein